jgi:tRNA uridine 5-carboxymethylaminomethyl modification enzyme
VFLEQEGWDTEEVYVQGLSNSMPRDVQLAMLHSMDGLEECVMLRPGYAIEYDCLDPRQLVHSLEVRELAGLYCAGQINGTSGYEEAAAQGIITGINAAHAVMGRAPVMLPRVSSYIGVMVDDLTTRGLDEPYRMLTGRAEMRLALGVRTARERLSNAGLAPDRQRHGVVSDDAAAVAAEMQRLSAVQAAEADSALAQVQGGGSYQEAAAGSLPPMRFPERLWSAFEETARFRPYETRTSGCHSEGLSIPGDFDYRITPLRLEARERLGRARPTTVGQAARLTGICAADVATLTMLLRSRK